MGDPAARGGGLRAEERDMGGPVAVYMSSVGLLVLSVLYKAKPLSIVLLSLNCWFI